MFFMHHKRNRLFLWLCTLLTIFSIMLSGCGSSSGKTAQSAGAQASTAAIKGDLHVYMLNVGQSDATLIQYKGKNMLIDTGDVEHREDLVKSLRARNVKELDAVLITHPHADHLGGMASLFKEFKIHQIYDNGQASNTAMYKNYLKSIKEKNVAYKTLKKGDSFTLDKDVQFQVFAPSEPYFSKTATPNLKENSLTNNNSIVCKMTYKDFAILFSGDAEKESEERMVKEFKTQLRSDVLKAGHHGSKTASSLPFLQAVMPKAATISCAAGNSYGFPNQETLQNLKKVSAQVYRTDQDGTITIFSDGASYSIKKEH